MLETSIGMRAFVIIASTLEVVFGALLRLSLGLKFVGVWFDGVLVAGICLSLCLYHLALLILHRIRFFGSMGSLLE